MPDRAYTDAELDAAIAEISRPDRLREAQDIVMRAAPSLQSVLAAAIAEGGWFDAAPRAGGPRGGRRAEDPKSGCAR